MSRRPRPDHITFRLLGTFSGGQPEEDLKGDPVQPRTAIILILAAAVAAFFFGLATNVIPQ